MEGRRHGPVEGHSSPHRHLLVLLLMLLAVAGCGGSQDPPAASPGSAAPEEGSPGGEVGAEAVLITIVDYEYEVPDAVPAGAQVTVRNEDSVTHTVTADDETTFDVTVEAGAEATFTAPDGSGEYGFFCRPHPYMTSTLVVE